MGLRVRRAGAADRAVVVEFLRELIPEADPERRYDWLYRGNPGGEALTWLAEDDETGAAAGITSFFPIRLWLDRAEVPGTLGGDAWVRPAFRRRGIGQLLHAESRKAMSERGFRAMYGTPGQMNVTPLLKGGSKHVADAVRWARPVDTRAVGVRFGVAATLSRALLRPRRHLARLEPITGRDPRVDAIWAEARRELRLAAVRDSAFYEWRFVRSPAHRQRAFVVVRDDGRAVAACAVESLRGSLRVIDLCAPAAAWGEALRAIVGHAAEQKAPLVDLRLTEADGVRRQLWRHGFLRRDGKAFLVMVRDGDERSPCLDPQAWFFTQADSDLDFLES